MLFLKYILPMLILVLLEYHDYGVCDSDEEDISKWKGVVIIKNHRWRGEFI